MKLDIPLAGWILSVIAFLAGTIIPLLYRRFFYEGIAIKQPYDFRAVTQQGHDKESGHVLFSTIVKIANARKESLLLDNIKVLAVNSNGLLLTPSDTAVHSLKPNETIHIPFFDAPDYEPNFLPLIIKSDEERVIGLQFRFKYDPRASGDVTHLLSEHIANKGLPVSFRINGKYRDYVLRIRRNEA